MGLKNLQGAQYVVLLGEGATAGIQAIQTTNDALGTDRLILLVGNIPYLFDGADYKLERGVTTLKTVNVAALATNTASAIWTPAAGKKFRLRGVNISSEDMLAGELVEILDGATVILNFRTGIAGQDHNLVMEANGYISGAINNVLNVRHQGAAGRDIAVNAWGNEE